MQIRLTKNQIPWLMAAARAALGPVIVLGERCNWSGTGLAALVVSALVSDIFDGVLARRWKCDTPGVRLFDSMADTFFYVCVGAALWFGRSPALRENAGLLLVLVGMELAHYALDFAKFGKPASYHSYLAKAWGDGRRSVVRDRCRRAIDQGIARAGALVQRGGNRDVADPARVDTGCEGSVSRSKTQAGMCKTAVPGARAGQLLTFR